MPRVEATVFVPVPPDVAFWVSMTTGDIRHRWDVFIARQELLDGATVPAKGVRTLTVSRHRMKMVSKYTSFRPHTQIGMKMTEGPRFFKNFGGGWSYKEAAGGTDVTWRYTFTIQPDWLAPLGDRIGVWVLTKDIERRIAGYAKGCADPVVLEAANRSIEREQEQG